MLKTTNAFWNVVADITKAKPQAKIVEHNDGVTIFNQGVFPELMAESLTLTVVDGHKVVFSYEENLVSAAHIDIVEGDSRLCVIEQSKPKIKSVLGLA